MTAPNEYVTFVSDDGDVRLFLRDGDVYAQVDGTPGLKCGHERSTEEHAILRRACADAANAMRALDDTVRQLGDGGNR